MFLFLKVFLLWKERVFTEYLINKDSFGATIDKNICEFEYVCRLFLNYLTSAEITNSNIPEARRQDRTYLDGCHLSLHL